MPTAKKKQPSAPKQPEVRVQIPGVQNNFDEFTRPRIGLPSTLDYLFIRLRGGVDQAIRMAAYGPLADERSDAILAEWREIPGDIGNQRHCEYKLEEACQRHRLKPSEFVGMVVAGMSKMRLDYEELIKAQEMPELLERSLQLSHNEGNFQERHEHLKAAGHHLAPKAAQVVVDNRDQRVQFASIEGLPSMEDDLAAFESVGQRRLPQSSAQPIEVEAEPVPVPVKENNDVNTATRSESSGG